MRILSRKADFFFFFFLGKEQKPPPQLSACGRPGRGFEAARRLPFSAARSSSQARSACALKASPARGTDTRPRESTALSTRVGAWASASPPALGAVALGSLAPGGPGRVDTGGGRDTRPRLSGREPPTAGTVRVCSRLCTRRRRRCVGAPRVWRPEGLYRGQGPAPRIGLPPGSGGLGVSLNSPPAPAQASAPTRSTLGGALHRRGQRLPRARGWVWTEARHQRPSGRSSARAQEAANAENKCEFRTRRTCACSRGPTRPRSQVGVCSELPRPRGPERPRSGRCGGARQSPVTPPTGGPGPPSSRRTLLPPR